MTAMTGLPTVQARTGLSPEWDRGFDEAFTDLIANDDDLVRAEFDALIRACWRPPAPAAPPAAVPPGPGAPASDDGERRSSEPHDVDPDDARPP